MANDGFMGDPFIGDHDEDAFCCIENSHENPVKHRLVWIDVVWPGQDFTGR